MSLNERMVMFTSADLSTAQGSTEVYYVASGLVEEHELDIVSPHDPQIPSAKYRAIPSPDRIPALLLYNFLLFPYFLYICSNNQYDVIYTYKGFSVAPCLIATLTGAKWVADFRTKPTGQGREWSNLSGGLEKLKLAYYSGHDLAYRVTLPHADAVISLSEPICDHLHGRFGVAHEKLYLVPLGVDTDRFRPPDQHIGLEEPIDMVYLGSIGSQRNLGLCIGAIARENLKPDVRLHLVGDGPEDYLDQLRRKANEAGVTESVCWHGYVDHEEVPAVLDRMDVAISPLPAHDSYEVSSPAKLFEYLAMGLPILCTDIQAHRNVLSAEQTGFFFQPGSQLSLVNAMNRLSELESEDWLNIRQHAREVGEENDWSVRLKKIESIVNQPDA